MTEEITNNDQVRPYDYRKSNRKRFLFTVGLLGLTIFIVFFDLYMTTSGYMSIDEFFKALFWPDQAYFINVIIVRDLQAPISILGILCGATFGFAGAVMQTMLNNPLASPYTLGISSGATLGAALAIAGGLGGLSIVGMYLIPAAAFIFAMITCAFIFIVAKRRKFNATILILAGVGVVQLFTAIQSVLQYFVNSDTLRDIAFWTMGSLEKATWKIDALILVLFVIGFVVLYSKSWLLTAMRLGDNKARSMGINVEKLRKWMFLLISVLTAGAVSFVGAIGFIGIVAPHMARMVVGEDQRYLLVTSALLGAVVLECADIASKCITVGIVYPIGTITAIIGLPVYFALLMRKKGGGFE
ncbi:iron ABC transporter permease protein [methanogenic archaeon mixed culture ISO4-G1]|nr:iron ABC transporter permease protein [methanogenic archaeon mixed culture ISO4-G1]